MSSIYYTLDISVEITARSIPLYNAYENDETS